MMIAMLLLTSAGVTPAIAQTSRTDPPVQVSFNDDGKYVYGDRARVYVRPDQGGYLVVLRADDRGGVRVLSPVDPDGDQQTAGGKKYEVKDRGGREAFVVEDSAGQGTVLAAWSRTPFDLRRYDRNGHWDYGALGQTGGRAAAATDAETRLLAVVDAMKPDGRYQYDVATYVVDSPRYVRAMYPYAYPWGWNGGWWGFDPWWDRPSFGTRVVIAPRGFRRFR
jgi:hypothetical protein